MAGNIYEWCWDWYDSNYYASSPDEDPRGPASGSNRMARGGSWDYSANDCRVARRSYVFPGSVYSDIGLRLVRAAP